MPDLRKKTKAPLIVYRRTIISYLLYSTDQFTLTEISEIMGVCYNSIHYYKSVVIDQLSAKRDNDYKNDIAIIKQLILTTKSLL